MSRLVAVSIESPGFRHKDMLYEALRHTLANLHGTTEKEMPVELIDKAFKLSHRAYETALENWWKKISDPALVAWGGGFCTSPGYSIGHYREGNPPSFLASTTTKE